MNQQWASEKRRPERSTGGTTYPKVGRLFSDAEFPGQAPLENMSPKKKNPHMSIRAIDPPRDHPPRRWQCSYCGAQGLLQALRDRECTYVYPPCSTCGQTPECAPDCAAVLGALSTPGVRVIGFRKD